MNSFFKMADQPHDGTNGSGGCANFETIAL
jgi:hypothetical protein